MAHLSTYQLWCLQRDAALETVYDDVCSRQGRRAELGRESKHALGSHEGRMEKLRQLQSTLSSLQVGMHGVGLPSKKEEWERKEESTLRSLPPPSYPPVSLGIKDPIVRRGPNGQKLPISDARNALVARALYGSTAPPGSEIIARTMVLYTPVYVDTSSLSSPDFVVYSAAPNPHGAVRVLHMGGEQSGKGIPCWSVPEAASEFGFPTQGTIHEFTGGGQGRDFLERRDGIRPSIAHKGRVRCVARVLALGKGTTLPSPSPDVMCLEFQKIRPVALHSVHWTEADERRERAAEAAGRGTAPLSQTRSPRTLRNATFDGSALSSAPQGFLEHLQRQILREGGSIRPDYIVRTPSPEEGESESEAEAESEKGTVLEQKILEQARAASRSGSDDFEQEIEDRIRRLKQASRALRR